MFSLPTNKNNLIRKSAEGTKRALKKVLGSTLIVSHRSRWSAAAERCCQGNYLTQWMTGVDPGWKTSTCASKPEVCFRAVCHPADLHAVSGLTIIVNGMCGGGCTAQHFLCLYVCLNISVFIYQSEGWWCSCAWRAPGKCWQLFKEQLCNLHNLILVLDTENIVNGRASWCCTDMTAFTVLIDAGFFFSLLPTCAGEALNLHITKFWKVYLTSNPEGNGGK